MTTYTIKPLVWAQDQWSDWVARSDMMTYQIEVFDEEVTMRFNGWNLQKYSSIEEAKAAAEAHYRNRVLEFLEEVK